jgi:hypothetical protein
VLDSGCTQHMTGDMKMFTQMNEEDCSSYDSITFGDNRKGKVKGLGKIAISNDHSISNVLLVESLNLNLLSVAQLCDSAWGPSRFFLRRGERAQKFRGSRGADEERK